MTVSAQPARQGHRRSAPAHRIAHRAIPFFACAAIASASRTAQDTPMRPSAGKHEGAGRRALPLPCPILGSTAAFGTGDADSRLAACNPHTSARVSGDTG
jgi:hypothetical protein